MATNPLEAAQDVGAILADKKRKEDEAKAAEAERTSTKEAHEYENAGRKYGEEFRDFSAGVDKTLKTVVIGATAISAGLAATKIAKGEVNQDMYKPEYNAEGIATGPFGPTGAMIKNLVTLQGFKDRQELARQGVDARPIVNESDGFAHKIIKTMTRMGQDAYDKYITRENLYENADTMVKRPAGRRELTEQQQQESARVAEVMRSDTDSWEVDLGKKVRESLSGVVENIGRDGLIPHLENNLTSMARDNLDPKNTYEDVYAEDIKQYQAQIRQEELAIERQTSKIPLAEKESDTPNLAEQLTDGVNQVMNPGKAVVKDVMTNLKNPLDLEIDEKTLLEFSNQQSEQIVKDSKEEIARREVQLNQEEEMPDRLTRGSRSFGPNL